MALCVAEALQLKAAAARELKALGYSMVKTQKGFVYAEGELPVMLVAHLDTVHKQPVTHILYSNDGNLIMSPEGIGGDDRAGVYAILQIVRENRCQVLFCEDEEIGGHGAREFASGSIRPDLNYIVELDRRGGNDAVFYGCDNQEFTDFVCGFGFREAHGTFSDISIIAPRLGVAAVNISAGYHNEHSRHEYINLAELQNNIERVGRMAATPSGEFEYIERQVFSLFEQISYEPLSIWGSGRGRERDTEIKRLMPLSDNAYLKINGHIVQPQDSYYIDEGGRVYNYIDDLDAAVLAENTSAYSESGLPLRFSIGQSRRIKVITYERALEKMSAG